MTDIQVRPMKKEEANEVRAIGRRAFSGLESLVVPKPKQALVATKGGKIVGAILYLFFDTKQGKMGHIDFAFVDPACHGQGVGKVLYRSAVSYLTEQGCTSLSAVVKDDNVGSWRLFLENGFTRVSLPQLVKLFGTKSALTQYFATMFFMEIGMDYYVALSGQTLSSQKGGSGKQIGVFFGANLLLFCLSIFTVPWVKFGVVVCAYATMLLAVLLCGYLGTRFSRRRQWAYRLTNGGGLLCGFANLFGAGVPMIGNWYPARYEKADTFRRDMGLGALLEWLMLLAVFLLTSGQRRLYGQALSQFSTVWLVFRLIPFYPLESFGGRRVLSWNRWLYAGMAAVTLTALLYRFVV